MSYEDEYESRPCTREEYAATIRSAGGLESLAVLRSYTRTDGDEWGTGKRMDTLWGTREGVPVAESSCRNPGGCETPADDEWTFWLWGAPKVRK